MPDCPDTPRSERSKDIGFVRKRMVGWFDPAQLIGTGIKALLSSLFGAYADKREIQAVLEPPSRDHEYEQEEIWVDYIADLGDGWNSTYTMARTLAREKLFLTWKGVRIETVRGEVLVMGGDQVYPTATREEYRDRLTGPYRAALPCVPRGRYPHLFAIPGNHDWYDGLTSFLRLFCQGRWIGGWRTHQSRSYFAIRLPHRWWLWGVDIQLESDIDKPQREYFEAVAKRGMREGDRVILCTAKPSWIYASVQEGDDNEAGQEGGPHHNLTFLEERIIRKYGGTVPLTMAGDLHHYCRYQEAGGRRHKITAGGGGAYLCGTHTLPATLTLREGEGTVTYARTGPYPTVGRSRVLTLGNLLFPVKNWRFSAFLGGLYLLYAWILQSASKKGSLTFMEEIRDLPVSAVLGVLGRFYTVLAHSPASVMFLLTLLGALVAFCDPPLQKRQWLRTLKRFLVGMLHGFLHLAVNIALVWGFSHVNLTLLGLGVDDLRQVLLVSAEMFTVGGLAGGFLMGLYLLLTNNLLGFHKDEVFSSLHIEDYKNFLRLHIEKTGLTIYPVGVRKVPRRWRFMPGAQMGEAWFEPAGRPIEPHLLEGPIHIGTAGG